MKTRLSIDPGLLGTGVAIWNGEDWGSLELPVLCGNITPKRSKDPWEQRAVYILYEFDTLLVPSVEHVYFEWPDFHDDAGGHTTARRGDLRKLLFVASSLISACWLKGIPTTLFEVWEWKGQLPKELVEKRIKQRLPEIVTRLKPTTHSWDAIGVGLHAKGHLHLGLKEKPVTSKGNLSCGRR